MASCPRPQGELIDAPDADAGPAGVLGELSYRAAELPGTPPSPFHGGVASGVTRIVFTGDPFVDPIESAAEALGEQLAAERIGNHRADPRDISARPAARSRRPRRAGAAEKKFRQFA